jgi:hypothetical protein
VKCGYLFKYRPWAEGVFKDPWARRFFRHVRARQRVAARAAPRKTLSHARPRPLSVCERSLVGSTLLSFKSEHDAAHLPRASITLDESCTIEARSRALCTRAHTHAHRTFRAPQRRSAAQR